MTNAFWIVGSNSDRWRNPLSFCLLHQSHHGWRRPWMRRTCAVRSQPVVLSVCGVTNGARIYAVSDISGDGCWIAFLWKWHLKRLTRRQAWHFDNLFPSSCVRNQFFFFFWTQTRAVLPLCWKVHPMPGVITDRWVSEKEREGGDEGRRGSRLKTSGHY